VFVKKSFKTPVISTPVETAVQVRQTGVNSSRVARSEWLAVRGKGWLPIRHGSSAASHGLQFHSMTDELVARALLIGYRFCCVLLLIWVVDGSGRGVAPTRLVASRVWSPFVENFGFSCLEIALLYCIRRTFQWTPKSRVTVGQGYWGHCSLSKNYYERAHTSIPHILSSMFKSDQIY